MKNFFWFGMPKIPFGNAIDFDSSYEISPKRVLSDVSVTAVCARMVLVLFMVSLLCVNSVNN